MEIQAAFNFSEMPNRNFHFYVKQIYTWETRLQKNFCGNFDGYWKNPFNIISTVEDRQCSNQILDEMVDGKRHNISKDDVDECFGDQLKIEDDEEVWIG